LAEQLTTYLKDLLPPELVIFVVSMMPILELRGGLIAAAILDVNWFIAFPICVIGNMLFIPFILLFIKKVFKFLKRFEKIGKWITKLENRAHNKSKTIEKNKMIGLFSFVAIPLPGTGAWTGALIADVLGVRIKHSLPIITVGVITAGLIISFISYVIPAWI
jgi:uncharacterized membrane protein